MLSKNTLTRITSLAEKAKILALGESKHTSDGLYRAKFEIIKHLVDKGDVNCILFENAWAKTDKVNCFLESELTVEVAMSNLYGVWRSCSMAEFLKWLKRKRETGYDITVAGFDNQQPEEDLLILEEVGIDWIREELSLLLNASGNIFKDFYKLINERFKKDGNRDQLLKRFNRLADNILSQDMPDSPTAHLAKESISSQLRGTATYAFALAEERDDLVRRAYEIRDAAMASIAVHFAKGKKTVIWAHNLHIMKNGQKNNAWSMKTMGDHLNAAYGEFYKAMALTAYHCEVNWPGNPEEGGPPPYRIQMILSKKK